MSEGNQDKFPPRFWAIPAGATVYLEKPRGPYEPGYEPIEYVSINEYDAVRFERDAFLEGDSEWECEARAAKKELKELESICQAREAAARAEVIEEVGLALGRRFHPATESWRVIGRVLETARAAQPSAKGR